MPERDEGANAFNLRSQQVDLAALHLGKAMITFANSYIVFKVQGHDRERAQRMTLASSAIFSGAGMPDEIVTSVEELMGGQSFNQEHLIATPTYSYRMVLSREECSIFREYMPPRSSGSDTFGRNSDLFSEIRWEINARPARLLNSAVQVAEAVSAGLAINGFARAEIGSSGRICSLQFPIRYFAVTSGEDSKFHAEAGPVIVPRGMLGQAALESSDGMYLAQFAFNTWDEAELAVWAPVTCGYPSSRWFCEIRKLSADLYFLAGSDDDC